MIDIRLLRESPEQVRAALARRGTDYGTVLDAITRADEERRSALKRVEQLKAERNRASEEVARLKREKADASRLISELKGVSVTIRELDDKVRQVTHELEAHLLRLPNLPLPDLPEGDASATAVLRTWRTPRPFSGRGTTVPLPPIGTKTPFRDQPIRW